MSAAVSSIVAPRAAALTRRETERTDFEVPVEQSRSKASTAYWVLCYMVLDV